MPHTRSRLRTLLVWTVAGLAVVALLVFGLAGHSDRNGHPAPPLPSEHLSGAAVTLTSLRGRPALVTFWASWCGPCESEAPALERFSEHLDHRAMLVGVNWEDLSLPDARSFLKRYRWSFPNLRDPEGTAGRAYGLINLPTTFAIDSSGRVRATLRGPQTEQTLMSALAVANN